MHFAPLFLTFTPLFLTATSCFLAEVNIPDSYKKDLREQISEGIPVPVGAVLFGQRMARDNVDKNPWCVSGKPTSRGKKYETTLLT